MLLVTRTLLIILFTINTAASADVNLLIVVVVSFSLAVANSNGVYRNWTYNYLESFFYLQLGVFAGGVLYARHNHGSVTTVADTSIGITLVIVLYHNYSASRNSSENTTTALKAMLTSQKYSLTGETVIEL